MRVNTAYLGAIAAALSLAASHSARAGTWVQDNAGLRGLTVIGIAAAPSSPSVLYLQARSLGIYRSADGGLTWSKRSSGIPDADPGLGHLLHDGPAIHPTNSDIVWAVSNGQVYKTTTGGLSWSLSSTGTTVNGVSAVRAVVLDPANPDHLLAGTIVSGADGGVFESLNGGQSWTNLAGSVVNGSGIGNDAWPLVFDPFGPGKLYSGSPHEAIYRSLDGGLHWTNSSPVFGDASAYEVAANPLVVGQVWTAVHGATWMSSDSAMTWTRRYDFNGEGMAVVAWAPSNPQVAYAVVGEDLWRSGDGGVHWEQGGWIAGGPRCLAISPDTPNTLWVGTWGLGVLRSTDGGTSFAEANTGLPMTTGIHGSQPIIAPDGSGTRYAVLTGNLVYRKLAGETQWSYYGVAPGSPVLVDPARPQRWFAPGDGLYRSDDWGLTWTRCFQDGPDTEVFGCWMDPATKGRMLLGERHASKVWTSLDGGASWTAAGTIPFQPAGFHVPSDICGVPGDPQVIVAAAYPTYSSNRHCGYLWRSADGGATWTHIRDRMFYGDWRVGDGEWSVTSTGAMYQRIRAYCNYRLALDHHVFGDGSYACKMRIISSLNDDPANWAGFVVRMSGPESHWGLSGWLVYMRRNGSVVLYNRYDGVVINASETPVVADPTQWVSVRLEAVGNQFELFVNGVSIGSYTDPNHRFDGPGYIGFTTCQTEAEFDDAAIDAGESYSDSFGAGPCYGASFARWLATDAAHPGTIAVTTQGGGVWRSVDQGATWQRLTDAAGEGLVNYRPMYSSIRPGNLYFCRGSGYSWRVASFPSSGTAIEMVGQALSYSSLNLAEDACDSAGGLSLANYQGIYNHPGQDLPGEVRPARLDFDADGDLDQSDYARLQICQSGPGVIQPDPWCQAVDLDEDGDVDVADVHTFAAWGRAANLEPPPACRCARFGSQTGG